MSTQPTLEQRLDMIESRAAIQDLVSSYAHGHDRHDIDLLMSVWHDDAEYLMGDLFGDHRGLQEIRHACEGLIWKHVPETWHFTTNLLLKVDGDHASAIALCDCHGTEVNGRAIVLACTYHDDYERRVGRWAIARRRLEFHYITGWQQGWGLGKENHFRTA